MFDDINNVTRLIDGNELAEILGVSISQAYRLMRNGDIKTVRFGRLVRVLPQDLDSFILEHRR